MNVINRNKTVCSGVTSYFPINLSLNRELVVVIMISTHVSEKYFDKQNQTELSFHCPSERSLEDVDKKPTERSVADVNGREDKKSAR
ncbi:MAG: hypothetical protein ACWGKN_05995 [Desulfoprunum sp.]